MKRESMKDRAILLLVPMMFNIIQITRLTELRCVKAIEV